MMKSSVHRILGFAFLLTTSVGAAARADMQMDFSDPVVLGNTQAPGVWYKDRYVPAGFVSQQSFLGDDRLLQTISTSDAQANTFYNTQGRKFDLEPGTFAASIDLYIDAQWQDDGSDALRFAGFWGTGVDAADDVSAYPIIEISRYTRGELGVYVWDTINGGFTLAKALTAADLGGFHTLGFGLVGGDFVYTYDGVAIGGAGGNGAVTLSNIILQGHNTTTGVDRAIYWDNLATINGTAAVPEPASLISAAFALGAAGLFAARRARSRRAA